MTKQIQERFEFHKVTPPVEGRLIDSSNPSPFHNGSSPSAFGPSISAPKDLSESMSTSSSSAMLAVAQPQSLYPVQAVHTVGPGSGKKFNWRKGGAAMARGVKGLNKMFSSNDANEFNTIIDGGNNEM